MILKSLTLMLALAGPLAMPAAAEISQDALRYASQQRERAGLPPLRYDRKLARAAEAQARHQAATAKMRHDGPRGSRPFDRIQATGYKGCAGAENVAFGQNDAREVTVAWMNSAGHRRNIMHPVMQHGAVAAARGADGRLYWAMVLGARNCRR
ncbi:Cysteine-rich secretory protein family protein [Jannaschia seosinensis]|uniref:Cysteine-rich secretory protein family protein n=1 Tax=Jannaschia seosinensis TaxID=313367 RepID=A0A0M7B7F0_9RHOB|nr:CAP domain-containing protein [Jannaschia seosinensis]CUH18691.1 Cysteine-rich secretory protein family protein [Jannaschia seosinensis]